MCSVTSVLKILACGFDRRREESVGPERRRAGPEKSVRVDKTLDRDAVSQNPVEGASRADNAKFTMRASKNLVYDKFVFFRLERARRINQPSMRREICQSIFQKAHLAGVQVRKIFATQLPPNFRMPRKRPGSGAWRVNQDAIEPPFERERLCAIKCDHFDVSNARGFESFRHFAHAMRM